jgi:hypothetical protein
MTEAELFGLVAARCEQLNLRWFHCEDSRRNTCPAGFPDMVIVGHGILFRELKADGAHAPLSQRRWGEAIKRAGGNWRLWRPSDWENGTIQRELRELALCPMGIPPAHLDAA